MNYFRLISIKNPSDTAVIEDGIQYTYGQLSDMAYRMSHTLKDDKNNLFICKNSPKAVYIIKENSILKQLVKFLGCNAAGLVPVIVPSDVKKLPAIDAIPDNVCMAAMTSGTAGTPKILYRTYESWADFFPVQNKIFGINKESILFAHGSLAFTGNMNLYMAQFYEGAVIVAENKFNPERWSYIIKKEDVNSIYLIPSKLMLLPGFFKEPYNNIKSVISGSQSLGKDDADKIKKAFPSAEIVLYYGASELNYITYVKDIDMGPDKNLIGKPFPEVKVYVQDGEIYVDNKFHAEGITCPCSLSDRGYMDSSGNLYFNGRSDDIVQIHGRKVSLIHIEDELEKLGEVHEAAAVFTGSNRNGKITAFIDTNGNDVDIDAIFCNLRKTLSSYEMPCKIIVMDKMLYNESGKKDKKKISDKYIK